jgi:hypothetical protein
MLQTLSLTAKRRLAMQPLLGAFEQILRLRRPRNDPGQGHRPNHGGVIH